VTVGTADLERWLDALAAMRDTNPERFEDYAATICGCNGRLWRSALVLHAYVRRLASATAGNGDRVPENRELHASRAVVPETRRVHSSTRCRYAAKRPKY
jgi:hypothetical protein